MHLRAMDDSFWVFLSFFLTAGVLQGQFATKVMLLAGIRRRAVVTPSFIEVLRPFKAGEVESVNFYKVAAVSLCRQWTVLLVSWRAQSRTSVQLCGVLRV